MRFEPISYFANDPFSSTRLSKFSEELAYCESLAFGGSACLYLFIHALGDVFKPVMHFIPRICHFPFLLNKEFTRSVYIELQHSRLSVADLTA